MPETGINCDMNQTAIAQTAGMPWLASPSPSVWRKRLEHFGDNAESGHVTTIAQYDPNSAFAPHGHPDGEEIFVIKGAIEDAHGRHE
jgi:hypothetical protein